MAAFPSAPDKFTAALAHRPAHIPGKFRAGVSLPRRGRWLNLRGRPDKRVGPDPVTLRRRASSWRAAAGCTRLMASCKSLAVVVLVVVLMFRLAAGGQGPSTAYPVFVAISCFFSVLLLPPAVDSQLHPLLRVCCHPCRVLQPPASLESNHPGALMSVGLCSRPRLHGPDKPSAFVVFCCLNISVSCIPQLKSGLILRGAGGGCVTARRNQHNT